MRNHWRKINIFLIHCFIIGIFVTMIGSPSFVYSQGPHYPGFGPGMGSGMGPGMGRGMGLQREYSSQPCRGGMNMQRGIMDEPPYCRMLLDRPDLNLTSRQKDDIKKLQINHMKETFDLRSNLQIQKIELKRLRFSKDPDFKDIKAKLENISKIQLELQIKRAKLQLEADKILTQEQRDLLYLSPGMSVDIEWEDYSAGEEKPEAEVSK